MRRRLICCKVARCIEVDAQGEGQEAHIEEMVHLAFLPRQSWTSIPGGGHENVMRDMDEIVPTSLGAKMI